LYFSIVPAGLRQQRASIARIVEGCAPLKRFQHVLFAHERGPATKLPDDAVRYGTPALDEMTAAHHAFESGGGFGVVRIASP
jgi:hypothetical protein